MFVSIEPNMTLRGIRNLQMEIESIFIGVTDHMKNRLTFEPLVIDLRRKKSLNKTANGVLEMSNCLNNFVK